jgi:pimeloyl-ACP methyl ester carboxylesterase
MPYPWSRDMAGRLAEGWIESGVLRTNPLGDPWRRPVLIYLPPGYMAGSSQRYPVVYQLQGFTNQVDQWRNRSSMRPNFIERLDEEMAAGRCCPCLVVFVDCWTSLGGSQFLESSATGRYHTYLCDEVVDWVDAHYQTLPDAAHRGVAGHSSGGFGAMVTCMLRPDRFGALATHAGDALFELCYLPDFGPAVRSLRDFYGGSYDRFWQDFRSRPAFSKRHDHALINTYAMAACYSSDPDGTVRLPFEIKSGRLLPEVWERWLAWDPVRMAPHRADALRGLRAIWIDAGRHDEYHLDLGAAAFRQELTSLGITEVHFELFDAGHTQTDYRYPMSLSYLAERLSE